MEGIVGHARDFKLLETVEWSDPRLQSDVLNELNFDMHIIGHFPGLDFHVDVTIHERDGRFMATADLAEDSRDVGVRDMPQEAVRAALAALGQSYASEMAEGVELGEDQRR